MRVIALALACLLGLGGSSRADATGCAAFKWPVTREQALFSAATEARPGVAVAIGSAVELTLTPYGDASFSIPPERSPAVGTFGGKVDVIVPPQGGIQITLSEEAWIDVIQDGRIVHAADFSGAKSCPGIRKSVRFKLLGGAAIVQFSGVKKTRLKVAILSLQ